MCLWILIFREKINIICIILLLYRRWFLQRCNIITEYIESHFKWVFWQILILIVFLILFYTYIWIFSEVNFSNNFKLCNIDICMNCVSYIHKLYSLHTYIKKIRPVTLHYFIFAYAFMLVPNFAQKHKIVRYPELQNWRNKYFRIYWFMLCNLSKISEGRKVHRINILSWNG